MHEQSDLPYQDTSNVLMSRKTVVIDLVAVHDYMLDTVATAMDLRLFSLDIREMKRVVHALSSDIVASLLEPVRTRNQDPAQIKLLFNACVDKLIYELTKQPLGLAIDYGLATELVGLCETRLIEVLTHYLPDVDSDGFFVEAYDTRGIDFLLLYVLYPSAYDHIPNFGYTPV